jgi:hypothetical protein
MNSPEPVPRGSRTARPWALSRAQWIWVVLVLAAIGLAFSTYELLNGAPPANRWPGYYAARPATGQLVQPLTGSGPYQTFVLKSWLDAKIPFVPLLAIPYLSFLVIVPIVIPLLNLAAGSFRRFLTVGIALVVSQLILDVAYYLFQTYVIRDVRAGGGFGGWLVNQVWGNDQPFNGYPSGHITWTTIGILALWRLRPEDGVDPHGVAVPGLPRDREPAAALPDGRVCRDLRGVRLLLGLHVRRRAPPAGAPRRAPPRPTMSPTGTAERRGRCHPWNRPAR